MESWIKEIATECSVELLQNMCLFGKSRIFQNVMNIQERKNEVTLYLTALPDFNDIQIIMIIILIVIMIMMMIYFQAPRYPITVEAPVDQLLPISETLVKNVEETLRGIVQDAINESLFKFPTLKQAVEAKVVNKIFDTKRDQTIEFIKQFLQMQKMSTDIVFAPVPLPNELGVWDATLVTNSNRERVSHPSMISKTMNHMKHLSSKLYPDDVITDIESTGAIGNYKV